MKKIILFICIVALFACEKKENHLGTAEVRGRLFLVDTLTQFAVDTPLINRTVYIQYAGEDQTNYIFSSKTDAAGYFAFPNLIAGKSYTIYFEELINGVKFAASTDVQAPDYEARLIARYTTDDQPGVIFKVKDNTGNELKEVEICLYTSETTIGYVKGICAGSSYQTKTDARGNARFFGLLPRTYFAVFNTTVGGIALQQKMSFTISNKVEQQLVTLDTIAKSENPVIFTVSDYSGNILKDASVCIFTSNSNSGYINGNCGGSSKTLTTGEDGKASFVSPEKGEFYFVSTAEVNGIPLQFKGSFIVTDKPENVKINLQQSNGIQFLTVDKDGAAVGNAEICIFSSKVLFDLKNSCEGSNYNIKSNQNGQVAIYSLPKSKYFIYSKFKTGKDSLVIKDTVILGNDIVMKTLTLR